MAAAKVYVEQLYTRGHGWPPWEPESEVYPGDVGFFHDSGKLCRLFNVLVEKDDPINRGHRGTPDDFEPLRLHQYDWFINSDFFTPGRPIMTRKVTASAVDFQVVSDPIPAGVGVTYTCCRNLGAMLLPRSRTARVDIGDCKLVRDYIKNNIDSWYVFARQFFGEEQVPEGSLVLVRGCDKTESWVAAAFTERSVDAGLMFNGGLEPSGPGFKLKGSWKQTTYSFPETRDSEARAAPLTLSIEPTPTVLAAMFPPECRETVFVRVFKCWRRVRRLKIPKVIKAAAGPHDLPDSDGDPGSLSVASGDYDFVMATTSDLVGDIDPQQPDFSKHPIDPLLAYILQASPFSQYAIATDTDLYRIMSSGMDWADIAGAIQASDISLYHDEDGLSAAHIFRDDRGVLAQDMSTTNNSNDKSVAGQEKRSSAKRVRRAVNCDPCRMNKLKCDRNRPCSSCELRGTVLQCYQDGDTPDPTHATRKRPKQESDEIRKSKSSPEESALPQAGHADIPSLAAESAS